MNKKNGLFIFNNDLRVQDNQALASAAAKVLRLNCAYVFDAKDTKPNRYQCINRGALRSHFLFESLIELESQLALFNQSLNLLGGNSVEVIVNYALAHNIDYVAMSRASGVIEGKFEIRLAKQLSAYNIEFESIWQHTLLHEEQLPFSLDELPASFSKFRSKVEKLQLTASIQTPQLLVSLPPPINSNNRESGGVTSIAEIAKVTQYSYAEAMTILTDTHNLLTSASQQAFHGGCMSAISHLGQYFSTQAPSRYKETRNALDDWSSSTKFSPWLALGCLSVRQIYRALSDFERENGANESTYWILFELLWREYFHWYLRKHQHKVFRFTGIQNTKPLTSFNGERFAKWCAGNTPYPLVNAIMNQLNETGFISNRARQIAASSWVNELQGDWRYGAAYFEQQLIDYDVASNWGNWQYIAGVGADPRGGRWFNLEKQTQLFDPDQSYIKKWRGQVHSEQLDSIDSTGIDDWPIAK